MHLLFQRLCSCWKASGVSPEVDGRMYTVLLLGHPWCYVGVGPSLCV